MAKTVSPALRTDQAQSRSKWSTVGVIVLVVAAALAVAAFTAFVRVVVISWKSSDEGTAIESPDGKYRASMSRSEGPMFWGDFSRLATFRVVDKSRKEVFSKSFSGDQAQLACDRRGWARIVWSQDSNKVLFYAPKEFPPDTRNQLIIRVNLKTMTVTSNELTAEMRSDGFEEYLMRLVESP